MRVSLLARPDHSVYLFNELRRTPVNVSYYTFHAFRAGSVGNRLLPHRKTVPASAITADTFTLLAYPAARIARQMNWNGRHLEQWLAKHFLRPNGLEAADVIHYWPFYFAPHVRTLKTRKAVATIADFYEAEPSFANARYREAYRSAGLPFVAPFNELVDQNEAFRFEENFVVASEFTRRSYQLRFPNARVHVVSYGLMGAPVLGSGTRRPRRRWVFVGRVCLEKGIDDLFSALRELPDLSIDIIGPLAPTQDQYLRARASPLTNVRLLGEMRNAEILSKLHEYDAFVLPSLCDNYSLAVTEALCAGLPVVVTDHCGNASDVLTYGVGSVCAAGNPASLADAMRNVAFALSEENLRDGLRSFEAAEKRHPYGARMVEVYRRVTETHR